MKVFMLGAVSGLLFGLAAVWILKFSPWAPLPDLRFVVYVGGASVFGGVLNLLMGSYPNVSSKRG